MLSDALRDHISNVTFIKFYINVTSYCYHSVITFVSTHSDQIKYLLYIRKTRLHQSITKTHSDISNGWLKHTVIYNKSNQRSASPTTSNVFTSRMRNYWHNQRTNELMRNDRGKTKKTLNAYPHSTTVSPFVSRDGLNFTNIILQLLRLQIPKV